MAILRPKFSELGCVKSEITAPFLLAHKDSSTWWYSDFLWEKKNNLSATLCRLTNAAQVFTLVAYPMQAIEGNYHIKFSLNPLSIASF
nr:hypothetical protein [Legionella jordanis]